MVLCECCEECYHVECLGITKDDVNKEERKHFRCNWCDPYTPFLNNLSKKTENFGIPDLSDVDEDVESGKEL